MSEQRYSHDLGSREQPTGSLRETLSLELQDRVTKLNDQARIFIPLIGLGLIAGIPVLSKSPMRFLMLLLSPFVLLPLGFCLIHLVIAFTRIAKAKARIRQLERTAGESKDV
jgi:hypothetical protein